MLNPSRNILGVRLAMNILHLMKDYKPTNGGSVVRNGNMIDSYKRHYPTDSIFLINLEGKEYEAYSQINGVNIYRCTSLKMLIRTAYKIIREERIDIIEAHNFRFLFAAFIARKKNNRVVCEIHALYRMNYIKELISYNLLRKCDKIIVLANAAKKYLVEEKKIVSDKIEVIRNGAEELTECLKEANSLCNRLDEHKKKKKVIVAYMGSFIEWQGVKFIADNFDKILGIDDKIILLMLGNGEEYSYIEKKAKESRFCDRIIINHGVPKEEMAGIYSDIDVVIIPREKNLSTDTAVPLKAVEAMRMGKAILASGDNGIREVLNDNNAAIYRPGNIEDLICKLSGIVEDSDYRQKIAQKASCDASLVFTTWAENSRRMHEIYNSL